LFAAAAAAAAANGSWLPWWVRIVGSGLVNKLGLILVGTSFQSEKPLI
jgi:hypothetical protein